MHVNSLNKVVVKKGILHVELVNGLQANNNPNHGRFDDQDEFLMAVSTLL